MRVAVVGAGVSGLVAAFVLARRHEVTLFEARDRCGGHVNTIRVREADREVPVDTGFIVFNERNYPNLCRLFDRLGVESRESDMSFSVACEASGIEYAGSSLDTLFAQRRNLLRPDHWRMLGDIARFHRDARRHLDEGIDDAVSVAQFVARAGYGEAFVERYLVPLGASLWSCPASRFREFPVRFVLEFLRNHRMLQVEGRPRWRTVVGGSAEYVRRLVHRLHNRIRVGTPIERVCRAARGVDVVLGDGTVERFDEAVLATHADCSLALVDGPDAHERNVLACFPYQPNEAVLHTDDRLLPRSTKARASWNYRVPAGAEQHVSVTYDMNRLQGIESERRYLVSLNCADAPAADRVIERIRYSHPLFTIGRATAQAEHQSLVRRRGISYCGAYWGYGFHEDGVNSALAVCSGFGEGLDG